MNVVAPGTTDTPMLRDPARADAPVMPLPIGRLIQADEVAAWVSMLVGESAGTTTGRDDRGRRRRFARLSRASLARPSASAPGQHSSIRN
ncbi:MAG: hypothetical protein R3E48_14335 [Burkholderiaceae bacterium]